MSGRCFFDTNILVYAHDRMSPEKKRMSRELLFTHLRDGTAVLSPQVLSEFFVTMTMKVPVPLPASDIRKEILLFSTAATVDMDATLVLRAIDLQQRWQVSFWDAQIIAAAERAGCDVLYTEDLSDGQVYDAVTVRNPYTTRSHS